MKKALLLPLLAAALAASSAADAAVVRLPDTAQGGTGAVVDVPITVNPGTGILGIDMTITYDAAVLTERARRQAQDARTTSRAPTKG